MSDVNKESPGYREAIENLPTDLRPIFAELAEYFADHAEPLPRSGSIPYAILAAMVRDGWRPGASQDYWRLPWRAMQSVWLSQGDDVHPGREWYARPRPDYDNGDLCQNQR